MAVAHDVSSESHTGTTGSISQASFNWSHGGSASGVDGVLVFVMGLVTADDDSTAVDYGGKALAKVTGGFAADTATEPMSCQTWFYGGTDIPQDVQTVTVTRNNNANELWAVAITVTCSVAGQIAAVHESSIVRLEGDGTLAVQSVTDGSPGTNSMRYAAVASGLAAAPGAGLGSTLLDNFDTGNQTAAVVRQTTASQGADNVGFSSGTSDDRAAVHLAVKEVSAGAPTYNLAGDITFNPALDGAVGRDTFAAGDIAFNPAVDGTVGRETSLTGDVVLDIAVDGNIAIVVPAHALAGEITFDPALDGSVGRTTSLAGDVTLNPAVDGAVGRETFVSGDITLAPAVDGAVTRTTSLAGDVTLDPALDGTVTRTTFLAGDIAQPFAVDGNIAITSGAIEHSLSGDITLDITVDGTVVRTATLAGDVALDPAVDGQVGRTTSLSGDIAYGIVLDGALARQTSLAGDIALVVDVDGNIAIAATVVPSTVRAADTFPRATVAADLDPPVQTAQDLTGVLVAARDTVP